MTDQVIMSLEKYEELKAEIANLKEVINTFESVFEVNELPGAVNVTVSKESLTKWAERYFIKHNYYKEPIPAKVITIP